VTREKRYEASNAATEQRCSGEITIGQWTYLKSINGYGRRDSSSSKYRYMLHYIKRISLNIVAYVSNLSISVSTMIVSVPISAHSRISKADRLHFLDFRLDLICIPYLRSTCYGQLWHPYGLFDVGLIYLKYLSQYVTVGPPLWSSGQSSRLQIQRSRVGFPALPDFLRSSGSGTGFTQPREDNWGATWMKK
jgi:hypothetical protein